MSDKGQKAKREVCSVCYRRFVDLAGDGEGSGRVRGCPAHGIRKPARLTGKLLAREVVLWARTPGEHGGNPYMHAFVRAAQAMLGEE
jgi:hypothetical protein